MFKKRWKDSIIFKSKDLDKLDRKCSNFRIFHPRVYVLRKSKLKCSKKGGKTRSFLKGSISINWIGNVLISEYFIEGFTF